MTETIEYEQFDSPGQGGVGAGGETDLRRLSEIPLELGVEIGRTQTTVGETLDLRIGSVIELEREAGAPADLLVNGTPIARGEVVVVDARYGLRITEILDAQEQAGGAHAAAAVLPDAGSRAEAGETAAGAEGAHGEPPSAPQEGEVAGAEPAGS